MILNCRTEIAVEDVMCLVCTCWRLIAVCQSKLGDRLFYCDAFIRHHPALAFVLVSSCICSAVTPWLSFFVFSCVSSADDVFFAFYFLSLPPSSAIAATLWLILTFHFCVRRQAHSPVTLNIQLRHQTSDPTWWDGPLRWTMRLVPRTWPWRLDQRLSVAFERKRKPEVWIFHLLWPHTSFVTNHLHRKTSKQINKHTKTTTAASSV